MFCNAFWKKTSCNFLQFCKKDWQIVLVIENRLEFLQQKKKTETTQNKNKITKRNAIEQREM